MNYILYYIGYSNNVYKTSNPQGAVAVPKNNYLSIGHSSHEYKMSNPLGIAA